MRVTFSPIGNSAAARPNETVLDVARRAGTPIGNSCGGIGICNRCRVRIVEGAENLTPPTRFEKTPTNGWRVRPSFSGIA
jgi:ferredoxin